MRTFDPTCRKSSNRGSCVLCAAAMLVVTGCVAPDAEWPQWGGPRRDFTVDTAGLADTWPEDGPPRLWRRELGDGYSSIVSSDGTLYTMYRKTRLDEQESVVALNAGTGETVWEYTYPSPLTKPVEEWGHGPNATPLIAGRRIFTFGTNAIINCLDKRTGKVLWTRDLVGDRVAHPVDGVGYVRSPIAYKRTIIVAVGNGRRENDDDPPAPDEEGTEVTPAGPEITVAEGQSLMALDQATGRTIWKNLDFESGGSSPLLIDFDGQDQLVVYATGGIIGVDPASGEPLWHYKTPERNAIISPVWNGEDLLLWSVGNVADGSVALKLTKENGKTVAKEHWTSPKMRTEIGTPVRIGDCAFGSSGRLFMGMNLETGKRTWAKRGYQTVSCVYADGKVIILDEDGKLTLATATPEAFTVHSQCQITERYSYTPPTLVDTTLYLRDRKHIMALDVGASQ